MCKAVKRQSRKKLPQAITAFFGYLSIFKIMDTLTVATVLKPQGIRGELKIKVYLDDAEDLKNIPAVYIAGQEYALLNVRAAGEFAYIALRGIADRNAAELLRGQDIEALRSDCPPLPEGKYYIGDLEGCKVVTSTGEVIGEVVSVTPARTDIFTVKTAKGEESFAAADGVILDVDLAGKTITVDKKRYREVSV